MSDYKEFEHKMKRTCEALTTQLATIRAGRANAAVLDQIQVDYYGVPTPIQQVASISAPAGYSLPSSRQYTASGSRPISLT